METTDTTTAAKTPGRMTKIAIRRSYTVTRNLMELIRNMDADHILHDEDDPRRPELQRIKDAAHANDHALRRLCALRPEKAEAYKAQWEEAEKALDTRAAKLKLSFGGDEE